jgi:predicted HicB family RNase H-like nuclease
MMECKGYIARVEVDDDAGILHGEIINTRDVITFEGTSIDELRQALADSYDALIMWAAKKCGADQIITLNLKDFRRSRPEMAGIVIIP